MASNSIVDERTLREIYLAGVEIAVKEGEAKSLVFSYNRVNGVFATEKNDACWELPKNMSPAGCAVAG